MDDQIERLLKIAVESRREVQYALGLAEYTQLSAAVDHLDSAVAALIDIIRILAERQSKEQ